MYEIIPFKSVGPFEFKQSIVNYLDLYDFEFYPKEPDENWETYSYKDGVLDIYTENKIIVSITCKADCFLKGEFLIGMPIKDFFLKFGINGPSIKMEGVAFFDDREEDVYDVDDLGLQLWVDEYRKIVAVSIMD
ncbi:MAG TPA: hypothetical protein VGD35_07210 [Chitinophaga sp.]